jgi:hypothetical protein
MKTSCTIIIFLFFVTKSNNALALPIQSDIFGDTLIIQLSALDLLQYQGKPVDSLLAHLPPGYTTMKIGGWRSQRLAEVLYVIYPNGIEVGIHVRQFKYMDPHLVDSSNPKQKWDITLFKKEAIFYTIIFNGSSCINGCQNKFK